MSVCEGKLSVQFLNIAYWLVRGSLLFLASSLSFKFKIHFQTQVFKSNRRHIRNFKGTQRKSLPSFLTQLFLIYFKVSLKARSRFLSISLSGNNTTIHYCCTSSRRTRVISIGFRKKVNAIIFQIESIVTTGSERAAKQKRKRMWAARR